MTHKKVLVAFDEAASAWGPVRFLERYVVGKNVEVTACVVSDEPTLLPEQEEILDFLSALCIDNGARMRLRRLSDQPHKDLLPLCTYADLLIISKSALKPLALEHDFNNGSCALVAVPSHFSPVNHIVLLFDAQTSGVHRFKQFFQVFPRWEEEPDLTLLRVVKSEEETESQEAEAMFLDYLKHYNRSVGVLRLTEPLTDRGLRPLKYDSATLVVGTMVSLMSHSGNAERFKPFYDDEAALYLPPELI